MLYLLIATCTVVHSEPTPHGCSKRLYKTLVSCKDDVQHQLPLGLWQQHNSWQGQSLGWGHWEQFCFLLQEEEQTGPEGLQESSNPAGKSGNECSGQMQKGIYRSVTELLVSCSFTGKLEKPLSAQPLFPFLHTCLGSTEQAVTLSCADASKHTAKFFHFVILLFNSEHSDLYSPSDSPVHHPSDSDEELKVNVPLPGRKHPSSSSAPSRWP